MDIARDSNLPSPSAFVWYTKSAKPRVTLHIAHTMYYLRPDEAINLANQIADTVEEVASIEDR